MVAEGPEPFFASDPVELGVAFGSPEPQSRVTVAFRGLLVLPHAVALVVLGLVAIPLVILGWFAALILGRLPRWIAAYAMSLIAYSIQVNAYGFMVAGKFPPFTLSRGDHPLRVEIRASRLSRLKVLFRWLLAIPAAIASVVASNGLLIFSPILWIVTLVLGRMPRPFFGAAAAVIRYQARYSAYAFLVTDYYPRRLFGDWESERSEDDLRLRLSDGSKRLLVLIVILGVAGTIANNIWQAQRLTRTSPVDAAIVRLQYASEGFQQGIFSCGHGPKRFRCLEDREHKWSKAWDRFGSDISRISFPGSQQAEAAAVVRDAHAIAQALDTASRAKTSSAHAAAYEKVLQQLPRLESDAKQLFGRQL